MTKDEALKLALKTLEQIQEGCSNVIADKLHSDAVDLAKLVRKDCNKPIDAIREALAQSEQEPVAFRNKQTGEFCTGGFLRGQLGKWTPLYDHPYELVCVCGAAWEGDTMVETPSKREWVGLTDEEINDCMSMSIQKTCRAVEAKLREKNGC